MMVLVKNTLLFYKALKQADVPAQKNLYHDGDQMSNIHNSLALMSIIYTFAPLSKIPLHVNY